MAAAPTAIFLLQHYGGSIATSMRLPEIRSQDREVPKSLNAFAASAPLKIEQFDSAFHFRWNAVAMVKTSTDRSNISWSQPNCRGNKIVIAENPVRRV